MRAHAIVLLVVVALVSPAAPVAGEQSAADAAWGQGHQLMRRGDYAGAEEFYSQMADQYGPAGRRARFSCKPARHWPTTTPTRPSRSCSSC